MLFDIPKKGRIKQRIMELLEVCEMHINLISTTCVIQYYFEEINDAELQSINYCHNIYDIF